MIDCRFSPFLLACLFAASAAYGEDVRTPLGRVQIAGQSVEIARPTLSDNLTDEEKRARIGSLLAGLSYRQFARKSAVAPVRIHLAYLKNEQGVRVGHQVHVYFVVHTPASSFEDEILGARLFGETDDASADTSSAVTDQRLAEVGIDDASDQVAYRRVAFTLLEKVRLNGVLRVETQSAGDQRLAVLRLDPRFENRWQLTAAPATSGIYAGFAGWVAVQSIEAGQATFVEARLYFSEPEEWFSGSNFLRSKLPLAIQQSARDLRRKVVTP